MMKRARCLALCASLALAACATAPRAPQTAPADAARTTNWIAHHSGLASITGFRLSARLSSHTATGSARLNWRQRGEQFSARAAGPFGSGAIALSGTHDTVRIRNSDADFTTDRPQDWMQQQLGWSLPLSGLRYWALGMPQPGQAARYRFDAAGRLATLTQSGWHIVYSEYQSTQGMTLPGRIRLQGAGNDILLRIDAWQGLQRAPAEE